MYFPFRRFSKLQSFQRLLICSRPGERERLLSPTWKRSQKQEQTFEKQKSGTRIKFLYTARLTGIFPFCNNCTFDPTTSYLSPSSSKLPLMHSRKDKTGDTVLTGQPRDQPGPIMESAIHPHALLTSSLSPIGPQAYSESHGDRDGPNSAPATAVRI